MTRGPGSFQARLTEVVGDSLQWSQSYGAETNLDAALPAGSWSTAFDFIFPGGDSGVGFFPFTVNPNVPPVAQVANLEAAQAISAGAAFTLSWAPWVGAGAADRLSLAIANASGQVVVSAATDCAGEFSLAPGSTSFEIPAGRLTSGAIYTGYLTFAGSLFDTVDESVLVGQRGYQARTTSFPLKTTGSSGGGELGELGNPRIDGTNLLFSVTGTPGATYIVQRTSDLVVWTDEIEIVLPASGRAQVGIPIPSGGMDSFFRAITKGGGEPPAADPATLSIAIVEPGQLRIVVAGTAGATYRVESTTDYAAWALVQEVTIPSGGTSTTLNVPVPADADLFVLRAVAASGPPPVEGNEPTLTLTRGASGLTLSVTNGDATQAYVIQSTADVAGSWTDTPLSVTTDGSGAGTVELAPEPDESAAFYRARAQ